MGVRKDLERTKATLYFCNGKACLECGEDGFPILDKMIHPREGHLQ